MGNEDLERRVVVCVAHLQEWRCSRRNANEGELVLVGELNNFIVELPSRGVITVVRERI